MTSRPHLPQLVPIDTYGNGGFRFGGMSHRGSLLCLPSGMYAWDVATPDQITEASLELAFAERDEIDSFFVGTGRTSALLSTSLRKALREAPLNTETMQTGAAIRIFNILVGEQRRVAAALLAVT
ncbi:hypothetical protein GJW-30_1_02898 [Variibacter gotjawalensis]|uniref:Uncharacterized protein n=1 Tax=Variibacter gotjawalensis TaxID=1333996 RepID=A0A0S3PWQ5_9BRAD|nr:Mth938-like domain-containing protein [Variibacter gotjawalensis]NIK46188.1 uncharacterized protein [Variibacter gotjawalensis]RZS48105.1 uncharacterized protein EV661_0501 [Variibacter gotjawalensis]BAT60362.1 hypothetical protein GJW-30_1_02898 [Variibacter gotjawalensis]